MVGVTAALIGSAVVGAAATMFSGSKAAKAQKQAANMQVAESRRQYDTDRADFAPWRETGKAALDKLAAIYGVGPTKLDPAAEIAATSGYQFRLGEGVKAVERSASARGRLMSGASMKAIQRFGEGLASSEYNIFADRLAGLAGVGQSATAATSAAGQNSSAQIAAAYGRAGDARASSYANTGSAISQGVNNLASLYLFQKGGGFGK
jgi:hypothetical protein